MKITDASLKQEIIDKLAEFPVYYPNRTRTQHVIRCPECGDSHNPSHAHLSIRIDVDDDLPLFYRCFRCNASGMLTWDKLYEWDIRISNDAVESLKMYTRKSKKKHKHQFSDEFEDFIVPSLPDDVIDIMKVEYINARLGTGYSPEDLRKMKIVTNLNGFCETNHVKPDIPLYMKQQIQNYFVGFLSTNNNRIMFRNTKTQLSGNDFRWYNVILNEKNMNTSTFYSIPNRIDLYYTDPIHIHIAEGAFDILSIYENVMNRNSDHNYYYASCGAAASNILNFLIDRGINTGITLHLYADKDKSDAFHMKYLKYESNLYQWCDKIIIHRNGFGTEKDYGVPKERIHDTYRTIYKR